MSPERIARDAWRWLLVIGLIGVAVHRLADGASAQPVLYEVIASVAAMTIVIGTHFHQPARARAWHLLAAAVSLWVLGDLIWNTNAQLFDTKPFPSIADVGYLASYPYLAAAILRMARDRVPDADHSTALDATLITVAAALPAWVFLMSPAAADDTLSTLGRGVAVAYPLADLFVLAVLVRLLVGRGSRPVAYWLLLGGILLNLLADTLYAVPAINASYSSSSPIESLYLVGYLLIGAAALHPSMVELTTPATERPGPPSRLRLLWLGIAGLSAPVVMAIEAGQGRVSDVPLIVAGWAAIVTVAVVRLAFAGREIVHAGEVDPLTNLPNRSRVIGHVDAVLRERADVALVYLDLDRFHRVNEAIGVAAGDVLLVQVAERLRSVVRPGDVVARLGSDEFVVVCEDVPDEVTARAVADRLTAGLIEPFWVEGSPQFLSASIGISRATSTSEAAELLRDADVALKRAKGRGSAGAELFDPESALSSSLRGRFELDLVDAIERGELELHYQPIVDLRTDRPAGVEALVRWQHPEWGTTKPDSLLPIAEESGLIVPIGRWVLAEGLRQFRQWQRDEPTAAPSELTINVARRELLDPGYVQHVQRCLDRVAVLPGALVLDVADDDVADAPPVVLETLSRLRGLGVHVCIDRFGTGRRSLANVRRVDADRWKLDASFVTAVADDTGDRLVVNAVLQLGASLGVQVTVAGVETRSQRVQLERMGCTRAQGKLWAPPLPPGSVLDSVLGRVG